MAASSQPTQKQLLTEEDIPGGFRFGAVRAGIKASGGLDFACAATERPAAAAAMFTSNRVVAAPLIVGQRHLERSRRRIQALIVNAGNANCATGEVGIYAAQQICAKAGEILGCDAGAVFPSSTGIIGVPLPAEKLLAALPGLCAGLGSSAGHFEQMARAIMTTDTRPKAAAASLTVEGRTIRLAGLAKGAGMIEPHLISAPHAALHATMLVYLFTDAIIKPSVADALLQAAVETTFNRISIDGDTSTNDTVLLLASGASGAAIDLEPARAGEGPAAAFSAALHTVFLSLAKQIVSDGEGVGHMIELGVQGALSDADALSVARAIARSPLVKTAWAGCDPNWGRILAAAGRSGVPIDPALIDIHLGEIEICRHGALSPTADINAAHRYLQQRELAVRIDLGLGKGACRFWTTDLTAEYVRINADYST